MKRTALTLVAILMVPTVGTPLAQSTSDEEALKAEYVEIIETYGVTHFDFDIESTDTAAVERRNRVMAELQQEYPELTASYTLRTSTQGLLIRIIVDAYR